MKTILRIIGNSGKWKWQLILATVSMLVVIGVNLAMPTFVRQLLGTIEQSAAGEVDPVRVIWGIAAIMFGLYIARIIFQFLNSYFAHIAAWYTVAHIRTKLYGHLQKLSMRFYRDKQTGQLMSRVVEDTANFEMLVAHALPDLITSILMFAGVMVLTFIINPRLAALTCIPLPFILGCSAFLKKMRKNFSKRQVVSAELNGVLQDNFSGMKEIQIFNRQEYEQRVVGEKANRHAALTMKGIFWVSVLHPSVNFLTGIGTLIVILFGGLFALNGMPVTDITVFLLYLVLLYSPIATLARVLEDVQTAVVSGKRVFELMDTESDVKDSPNAKDVGRLMGEVSFKNVSFEYDKEVAVLKDVSFTAKAGSMVALVGPTGAGKTTVTSLLARFYDADSGVISIDGINIKDMTLNSLRDQISMVLQDVFLFNGTVAENIAYGCSRAVAQEEIAEAAKAACIHEFIEGMPDKYNTVIGERGVRLSGGQKQRLAIARAILRGSPVLIMDEATSAVDNETETEIQKAIGRMLGKCTIIVIAHRLTTIEKADEILVLNEGGIIERGTHKELLDAGGLYTRLQKLKS